MSKNLLGLVLGQVNNFSLIELGIKKWSKVIHDSIVGFRLKGEFIFYFSLNSNPLNNFLNF